MYKNKRVLVTGGTGLIGRPLVEMLLAEGAIVRVVSLDSGYLCPKGADFIQADLRYQVCCRDLAEGMDYVFHLAGVKGSPAMTAQKPASFFTTLLLVNTNMMEAARLAGVERYLYCSTIGVYSPAEVLREEDVWNTFPSENDKFAGWAKRMGELQAQAYKIEYGWDKVSIVRPANVYGPYDNFDPNNAMVIPSLISRSINGEDPLVVWGDGSQVRDFIHCDDVAKGMMLALEKLPGLPLNLGSGTGISIKDIVGIILNNMANKPDVVWDSSKPSGDKIRVMDVFNASLIGFKPKISIDEGIKTTMEWYRENKDVADGRHNIFKEGR